MTTDRERLQTAQWVLERNLAWIAAAEVKVGVIVAIDTAMLGGLGAALSATDAATRTHWAWFFLIASVACLCCGLFCAAMSVLPRITGPAKSLLFFGRINAFNEADYMASFKAATDTDLLEDWLAQIHRNAQIASKKYAWVRKSMWWSFMAVLPWLPAIVALFANK